MTALVDTSVLIDFLRGDHRARVIMSRLREQGPLQASEITRLEILAGMRPGEKVPTESVLAALEWHPVDREIAETAGELGRRWLPSHGGIDAADLAIAATAVVIGSTLVTLNVKHFPMFDGLERPY